MDALARLAGIVTVVIAALASAAAATPSGVCAQRGPAGGAGTELALPILMYHRVDGSTLSDPVMTRHLTVSPGDFAGQMHWLARHGYHTVTQLQLLAALDGGRPLPPRPVMITFDDGYQDVFFEASTVLLRLHMHATAYVISGRVSGSDASFLTWGLLHALERRGIEIGSHTVSHLDLTGLSDRDALRELVDSRRVLERRLGHPVLWFAYPGGAYDARVERLVCRAGYRLAVTTVPGVMQPAGQPLALHRLRVSDTTGVGGLAAMLAG